MILTPHFSLDELTVSQEAVRRGIDNDPPERVIENLRKLARALENVRTLLSSFPLLVSSGYRSPELNEAVKGSKNSAHLKGLAADFICPSYGSPREVALAISRSSLIYDQVIHEGRWVHFGLADQPRQEVLTAHFEGGRVSYSQGIA